MIKKLNFKIDSPLPEVEKIITSEEASNIYFVMGNNINIQTNHQKGINNAVVGNNNNNNVISIVNKNIYWYGVISGIVGSIIINLLSNFIYDLIK